MTTEPAESAPEPAGTAPRKRRKVPVSQHVEYTALGDGRVRAHFAPVGVTAEGDGEEGATRELLQKLMQTIQSDTAAADRFNAFAEEYGEDVEEEPIPQEVADALHRVAAIDPQRFEETLDSAPLPLLVDFWAPWCQPCLAMAPDLAKVAEVLEGRLTVGKVNVDEAGDLGAQFEVKSIPTLVLFRDGGEVARWVGARGASSLLSELEPHL